MENTTEIDQILDKMNEIGYENLENNEKSTLNQYSEWLNSGKKGEFTPQNTPKNNEIEVKNDDYNDKTGDEYTTYLPDGSGFSFRYDYSDVLTEEILHYGVVKYHGEDWSGLIATDNNGKITEIDFVLESNGFQSYDSSDEFAGYDEEKEVRLQDVLGNDLHQVKYFLQEEVISDLMD